ncbi:MAG: DUF2254 domain-containing protein [Cellulomonas sp.]
MSLLKRLRERFWFVPAVMCLFAVVLAEALISLDRHTADRSLPGLAGTLFYQVGESGSRDILAVIATSSLGVAGTTFSITIAVLALTSSSYGPRLVRNFMADRGNQIVLGVYVATFLYSLLVLRAIRTIGDPQATNPDIFVPHLAVNAAVLLGVANVGVLVYFIHHISDSIQVSTLSGRVRADLLHTIDRLYPATVGDGPAPAATGPRQPGPDVPVLPVNLDSSGERVLAERAGYVQFINGERLFDLAVEHDVLLALQIQPGEFVLEQTTLARVHRRGAGDLDWLDDARSAVQIAAARTPYQDIEFAVQQLTEMAVRALSPGTNDPYTAVNALDDLSVGLAALAARDVPAPTRIDDDGVARVHAPHPGVLDLVSSVVDAMRWYAASVPLVTAATLRLLERVGNHASVPGLRGRLLPQVDLLVQAVRATSPQEHDLHVLLENAAKVRERLAEP